MPDPSTRPGSARSSEASRAEAKGDWREPLRSRLRGLRLSPAREAEIIEEMSQHLMSDTTSSAVVVLAPVAPGTKALSVAGNQVSVDIADKDLREVAIASTSGSASVMANVRYAFGGQVVETTPSMSLADVNAALAQSNAIVW